MFGISLFRWNRKLAERKIEGVGMDLFRNQFFCVFLMKHLIRIRVLLCNNHLNSDAVSLTKFMAKENKNNGIRNYYKKYA